MAEHGAPLVLGFDTSGPWCAAALLRGDNLLDSMAAEMAKGQAESLLPLLEDLLARNGAGWSDLSAIGVGVGPGNFTGIRISVSAARGLALGLGIPAVGIDGFAARGCLAAPGELPVVPAPRDQVYVQLPGQVPALMPIDKAASHGPLCPEPSASDLAEAIARLASARWQERPPPPAPLYVKPADAAPSRDAPPRILDA